MVTTSLIDGSTVSTTAEVSFVCFDLELTVRLKVYDVIVVTVGGVQFADLVLELPRVMVGPAVWFQEYDKSPVANSASLETEPLNLTLTPGLTV
jgi:hypothetical protein